MSRTRTVVVAGMLLSLLAVGACFAGDPQRRVADPQRRVADPQPAVPMPSAATPTDPASTPATGGGPTMPAAARRTGESGARAFVRYWFALLTHAIATGDTGPLAAGSAERCTSCSALIAHIDKLDAKGGRVRTDGWVVERSTMNGRFRPVSDFRLRVREGKRTLFDGDRVVDRTPAEQVRMYIVVDRVAGDWVVTKLAIIE